MATNDTETSSSDPTTPVVHLIDDNQDLRNALRRFIEHNGLECRAYSTAEEFLGGFEKSRCGCVVLDIQMPGMSGLALQEELQQLGVEIPVIILTGHADVPVTLRAWHNGAFDLLEKPVSNQILMDTIRRAVGEHQKKREQRTFRSEIEKRVESLTPRERQVMRLVVAGNPNKAIGAELGLSQKTVEVHRSHVMRKMAAQSLPELVRMAMMVEPEASELQS